MGMLCGVFIGSSPFFVSTQLLYVPEYKIRTLLVHYLKHRGSSYNHAQS